MFWTYVLYAILFSVGTMYAGFAFVVPMICVNFALPATRKLADKGWFNDAASVRKKYRKSVKFWALVNLVVFAVFFCFVPLQYMIAFYAGTLWTVILSGGRTGANEDNINEYLRSVLTYSKAESESELAEMIEIIRR